jgi:3-oxoacyl-(acyl-carrier-protein) synthase
LKGVAITGVGMVSGLGRGLPAHLDGFKKGVTALAPLTLFTTPGLEARPVAEVRESLLEGHPGNARSQRLALAAAKDALGTLRPSGAGVIAVGSTTGGIFESEQHYLRHRGQPGTADRRLLTNHALGSIADRLGKDLAVEGERHTFATACSSSANAIGYAAAKIEAGAPWALAGGVDSLCRLTWAGFHSLKLLSAAACKPFDRARNGLSLGEAAAFLLLEPMAIARARGAEIFGQVTGWGCSADAYHMTAPHPEGLGAIAAMRAALKDAGCAPEQIDYVNAHGTATPANDKAEALALRAVFGAHVPPTSSTKGVTGHSLGAAGALEAAIGVLAIREGFLPGNVGLEEVDPELGFSPLGAQTTFGSVSRVISNSFGFGGNNTALVLERAP